MSVEIAWGRQRDRVRTTQAARRSAGWRAMLSSCVCPSKTGVVSKRVDNSSWFFWHGGFLCCVIRKFGYLHNRVSPVLPSETLSQTLNFTTASRSCCQQNSPTVELCWPHLRRSPRLSGRSMLFATQFTTRPSTVMLQSGTSICCGFLSQLLLQLCSSWQDFN